MKPTAHPKLIFSSPQPALRQKGSAQAQLRAGQPQPPRLPRRNWGAVGTCWGWAGVPQLQGARGVVAVACRLSPVAGKQLPAAALSEPRQAAKGQGRVPPPSGRPGRKSCCFQVGKWLKGLKNKRINPKSGPQAAPGTQRGGQGGGGAASTASPLGREGELRPGRGTRPLKRFIRADFDSFYLFFSGPSGLDTQSLPLPAAAGRGLGAPRSFPLWGRCL